MRQQLVLALVLLAACAPAQHSSNRIARANAAPIAINAPHIGTVATVAPGFDSVRNVFAFVEPPPVRPAVVTPAAIVVQPPIVQTPIVSSVVEPPKPPAFAGTCIGRFGPDDNPLAAFVVDGSVVNAHRGETIANRFLVQAIGIESVDLEPAGFPGAVQRVAIGQARR